jgi:hypothetical protein
MFDARTHDHPMLHSAGSSSAFSRRATAAAAAISAASMLVFGVWALVLPDSFGQFISYPPFNRHLMHDVGAFQIGIGVSVALALWADDVMLVALSGFVVAGTLHTWSHYMDRALGGHGSDVPVLGLLTLIGAFGIYAGLRGRKS